MEQSEALEILGLPRSATQEDVDKARRDAMKVVHSEGSAPNEEQAKRVNMAHAVASEPGYGTDLVRTAAGGELVHRNTMALEQGTRSRTAETAVAQVVTHQVGKLAQARRRRFGTAAVTGVVGAVGALSRTIPNVAPSDQVAATLTAFSGTLIVIGALLAVVAFLSKAREDDLQLRIEDAADALTDRGTLMAALAEIEIGPSWTRTQLHAAVTAWLAMAKPADGHGAEPLADVARDIGVVDFSRLILVKGLERGVIVETESVRDGSAVYGYRLVRPSH